MEFRIDRGCSHKCMTVYDWAAQIALASEPQKKVKRANIVKGNYIGVVVEFEDVVHTYNEFSSEIERNELPSHRDIKCILLSGRSQSKKTTCHVITPI